MNTTPNTGYTSDQAAQAAATAGLVLSEDDYQAIDRLQRAEQARIAQLTTGDETGIVAAYARLFPKVLGALHAIGDTALALARTFVIALGVPLVLVLLLIVEVERVSGGVLAFTANATVAEFAAISFVAANIVIEVMIHYLENKTGYSAGRAVRWSLRIVARDIAYRLGIGGQWTALELSPAQRYKRLRSLTTGALLFLAVSGSMAQAIASTPGKWYAALWSILTDSTLSSASIWVSGLFYSIVAILLAQGLASYVSIRVVEVLAELEAKQTVSDVDTSAALDAVKTQYIAAKTAAKLASDAELERQRIASEQTAERARIETIEAAERFRIANEQAKEAARLAREERKARNGTAREIPADDRQGGAGFLQVQVPSNSDPRVTRNGHSTTNGHVKSDVTP